MKNFYLVISSVCVTVGCVIGAGFATGREIMIFFGGKNPVVCASFCCVCFYLLFHLYFHCAKKFDCFSYTQLFKSLFGRFFVFADCLVSCCYFLISATMIAASGVCLKALTGSSLPSSFLSLLTVALCAFSLLKGKRGLQIANTISVPLIVAIILYFCADKIQLSQGVLGTGNFFAYCSFNCLLSCSVLLPMSTQLTRRNCFFVSLFSSVILSALILLLLQRLNAVDCQNKEMPLALIAQNKGGNAHLFYYALLYFSVFTTLCANAFACCQRAGDFLGNRALFILPLMYIFSFFGFTKMVDYAYPVLSFLAVLTTAFLVCVATKKQKPHTLKT